MRRREFVLVLAAVMTSSRGLRAQQKAMPVVGCLHSASPGPFTPYMEAFRRGLDDAGYTDGRNVALEYRWAESHPDRLPALAADLVGRKVDVIAAVGGLAATVASRNATTMIPVVFIVGGDPVGEGLVASLARPGGNLTGVSIMTGELMPKRLELLFELVPYARVTGLLINPNVPNAERQTREVQDAARIKGLQLLILKASTESEIDGAFGAFAQMRTNALQVGSDPFFASRREQIVALAERHAIPTIYEWREFAIAGGLISYGSNLSGMYHLAGTYVGRVLGGAKPADLPVQQPTTFELVINLKTAKALGLSVPPSILARADEVIE
jgi:putative ABC transport system substrate-binding protein